MNSTKQRFTDKLLAIFMVLILIVGCLSFSAFADSVNAVGPLFVTSSVATENTETINNGLLVSGNGYNQVFLSSRLNDTYAVGLISGSYVQIYMASSELSDTPSLNNGFFTNTNTAYAENSITLSIHNDSNYSFPWGKATRNVSYNNLNTAGVLPLYSSEDECLSALDSVINPPIVGPGPQALTISLPAGNVLIADIQGTGTNNYYLETTGGTTGATVKPGMNNIQIGYFSSIPQSITIPNSSLTYPSWYGTGKQSIFGTYNRQNTSGSLNTSNNYFVVANPMYPNDNNASANRLNSDLLVQIDLVNSYRIVDLNTGYVNGTLTGTNDGSSYINGSYDGDTGEWNSINQDGDPATPTWGGQNDFANTPATINDWLENIANQISSFFAGAIGAVTTLASAIGNFATSLQSLYTWLPGAVLGILTSAITLAITIGVIKVFI